MIAHAARAIGRRSKVAGRSEVSSRDTPGTASGHLSIGTIAKSSQPPRKPSTVDLPRNGPDPVRALHTFRGAWPCTPTTRILSFLAPAALTIGHR
jgi:hypothetical protein